MAGLKGFDRTPREDVRVRRNSQRLASNFTAMLGNGFEVDSSGLIAVDVQDPIFVDSDGVGFSHLGLEALADPGADRVMFWDDSETALKWLAASTGLQIVGTNISTKDAEIDHDGLSNFLADEHIDWKSTSEDLDTSGTVKGGTITDGAAVLSGGVLDDLLLVGDGTYYLDMSVSPWVIDQVSGLTITNTLTAGSVTDGTAILSGGTLTLANGQVTTPLVEAVGTTDVLSLQPDCTQASDTSYAARVKFFENVATENNSSIYIYGHKSEGAVGQGLKYVAIGIDRWGRVLFSGTTDSVLFDTELTVGANDGTYGLMWPNKGRARLGWTAGDGEGHSFLGMWGSTGDSPILVIGHEDQRGVDFGFGHDIVIPHVIISARWSTDPRYIDFYHDATDGYMNCSYGDLYITAAGGDINFDDDNLITTGGVTAGASTFGDGGSTNYAAHAANGDLSFAGTAKIAWTKITANGVAIRNSHGTSSDSVSDLQSAFDTNFYTLSEESGETPGMDIEVDFTGVTAFNWVRILGRYEQAAAGHGITIMLEITPFNGSAWHRINFMHDQGADLTNEDFSFFVPNGATYINSGVVKVRFVHEMAGTSSAHDLVLDEVALYQ